MRDFEAAETQCILSRTAGSIEWRGIVLVAVLSIDDRLVAGESIPKQESSPSAKDHEES